MITATTFKNAFAGSVSIYRGRKSTVVYRVSMCSYR